MIDYRITIKDEDKVTKVRQIVNRMTHDIDKGILKINTQVASINEFSKSHHVARETVEKAYKILHKNGYLVSVPGKGNFVGKGQTQAIKILMILNKMSPYKKEVYESFIEELGDKAHVHLEIHHYNPKIFRDIIHDNHGKYHYYAIMPHFYSGTDEQEYIEILKDISPNELVILDKRINLDGRFISVFQDFEMDIFEAMDKNAELFSKYSVITVVFPENDHHPLEITSGVKKFCELYRKRFDIISDVNKMELLAGQCFITLTEIDLARLIKKLRATNLSAGHDIGIVSFNETVFKELLEITVVSTDFSAMGRTAAKMIVGKKFKQVRNSFNFIKRASL
ncbi:winged helix-turn-helix domain-containing protein [Pedobacter psychrodurus]|nr:GntR family transcriptional regulator [Pedobacter psychrodurus]